MEFPASQLTTDGDETHLPQSSVPCASGSRSFWGSKGSVGACNEGPDTVTATTAAGRVIVSHPMAPATPAAPTTATSDALKAAAMEAQIPALPARVAAADATALAEARVALAEERFAASMRWNAYSRGSPRPARSPLLAAHATRRDATRWRWCQSLQIKCK
jgi:hypothetical protein